MFGTMPAYGFFVRHVNNLEMHHVNLGYAKEDLRPVIALQDVAGVDFDHIEAERAPGMPLFTLRQVRDFVTHNRVGMTDSAEKEADQKSF
jgi:hypothetical protein